MKELTICEKCKNCKMEEFNYEPSIYLCIAPANIKISPVTGRELFGCCDQINKGHCPDYVAGNPVRSVTL